MTPQNHFAAVDDKPANRREALVEAAEALFLEKGYEGTTLEAIIERVGGSRRAIYELFGGKEGLFEAIVCGRCDALRDYAGALDAGEGSPREALIGFGLMVGEMLVSEAGVRFYRLVVQEVGRNPWLGDRLFEAGVAPVRSRLAAYLAQETAAGRLNAPDADAAAGLFFGMVKGDLQMRALFCSKSRIDAEQIRAHVERATDLFLAGVLPRG